MQSFLSSIFVHFMALIEFFYKIFQLIHVKLETFNQSVCFFTRTNCSTQLTSLRRLSPQQGKLFYLNTFRGQAVTLSEGTGSTGLIFSDNMSPFEKINCFIN